MIPLPFALILGGIKSFLGRILSDWRMLLLIVVLAIGAYGAYKFNQQTTKIQTLETSLKNEQESNIVLRQDISLLQSNSNEKDVVIQQMINEKKLYVETIDKLSKRIEDNNRKIEDTKTKINQISVAPTISNSPYIAEALTYLRSKQ